MLHRWIVASALAAVSAEPIMVDPIKDHGPAKLLLYVPGGKVPPEDYLPHIKATQASSTLKLSAAVVRCHIDLCDPIFELKGLMEDAIARANKTGTFARSDIFVAGHSLGGVGARHFFDSAPNEFAGLALFGTQGNGDHEDFKGTLGYPLDLAAFPRPLLALAGELDMWPISHVAELARQAKSLSKSDRLPKLPLIVPGMDHSQFCPPFKVPGDIEPDISNENATAIAGALLAAWLDHVVLGDAAVAAAPLLEDAISKTKPIAAPYISAMEADKSWCAEAQRILAGKFTGRMDLSVSVDERFGGSSLEHCHPSITTDGGRLKATVCSYTYHGYLNATIPVLLPKYQGADDISCKMLSEDKLASLAGLPAPNMTAPEVMNRCSSINEQALQRAKELVRVSWPAALQRLEAQGKPIVFSADSQASIGPQWLLAGLSISEGKEQIGVQSEALISTVSSAIYPGNHYCKLLAPSRAVELVMTAALTHRFTQADGESQEEKWPEVLTAMMI